MGRGSCGRHECAIQPWRATAQGTPPEVCDGDPLLTRRAVTRFVSPLPNSSRRHGRGGCPDFTVDDDGLTVTDAFSFESDCEFLLPIQNANGGMALVDPRIRNQSSAARAPRGSGHRWVTAQRRAMPARVCHRPPGARIVVLPRYAGQITRSPP